MLEVENVCPFIMLEVENVCPFIMLEVENVCPFIMLELALIYDLKKIFVIFYVVFKENSFKL